ncbi:hypothetical protein ACFU5O_15745 [Streptomyces sp. NPDC057445]|uniref:hypothetical protein n=1 Tax=Streptomyces sp. NPDC057445 TaxID=3346136 RepID=UPI0036ABD811
MPHRKFLRTAVLASALAGAVLVPSTAAFADASPSPAPAPAECSDAKVTSDAMKKKCAEAAKSSEQKKGSLPRGGVAAGERPVTASDSGTTALVGTAAGFVLLAGAGTFVVRRRSAATHRGV